MKRGLVALALLLPSVQVPSAPKEAGRWLGVFTPFPGSRELCSQHITGESAGRRVEIRFTLYGTPSEPGDTAGFYARLHRVPLEPGKRTISVEMDGWQKILTVHPVSEPHPECGVKPASSDRTVIVVSEKVT